MIANMTDSETINSEATFDYVSSDDFPWETLYPSAMCEFRVSPGNILYTSYDPRTGERIVQTTKMKFVWIDDSEPEVVSLVRKQSKQ